MPSDSNDKDIREFFGDSGEQGDALVDFFAGGALTEDEIKKTAWWNSR